MKPFLVQHASNMFQKHSCPVQIDRSEPELASHTSLLLHRFRLQFATLCERNARPKVCESVDQESSTKSGTAALDNNKKGKARAELETLATAVSVCGWVSLIMSKLEEQYMPVMPAWLPACLVCRWIVRTRTKLPGSETSTLGCSISTTPQCSATERGVDEGPTRRWPKDTR